MDPHTPSQPPCHVEEWAKANEAVRDLRRGLDPPACNKAKSAHVVLPRHQRLCPVVGTASELAQPGGFRRAHVAAQGAASTYSSQPLVARLDSLDSVSARFTSSAMHTLTDGTLVRSFPRPLQLMA